MSIRICDCDVGHLSRDRCPGSRFPIHRLPLQRKGVATLRTTLQSRAGAGASLTHNFAVLLSDDRWTDDQRLLGKLNDASILRRWSKKFYGSETVVTVLFILLEFSRYRRCGCRGQWGQIMSLWG